jgi:hypothetical protein
MAQDRYRRRRPVRGGYGQVEERPAKSRPPRNEEIVGLLSQALVWGEDVAVDLFLSPSGCRFQITMYLPPPRDKLSGLQW